MIPGTTVGKNQGQRRMKVIWHWPGLTGLDEIRRACPDIDFLPAETAGELEKVLGEPEIAVCGQGAYRQDAAEVYKRRPGKLRWIQFRAAGIDLAVPFGFPKNVMITNAPGMSSPTISSHALAMLLSLWRGLNEWTALQPKGWNRDPDVVGRMVCPDNKVMVVIGYGSIAQALCQRAKAFGMKVIVVSRAAEQGPHVDKVVRRDKLREALAEADAVAMCTALAADNRHMLGRAELACMKKSAILLNISRGELVDEAALIEALRENRIGGAGLDVYEEEPCPADNPLWRLPNVVCTPHCAARGGNDVENFTRFLADQLRRWQGGEQPLHVLGPDRLTLSR
jgi:phosphoglycerate dehydrogenase-like enzyme